jgi:hypothetical protein
MNFRELQGLLVKLIIAQLQPAESNVVPIISGP